MSNVLHKNCLYFQIPEDLITHGVLAHMNASELKLYLALLYQAQRHTTTKPKLTGDDFNNLTRLATGSATAGRNSLVEHRLVTAKRGVGNAYSYELLNPITGHPMTNYWKRGASAVRSDGLSFLARKLFNLPKEEYERYYRDRLGRAEITNTSNGLSSRCPFHDDRNPSLEVGLRKGVWYCHPCGEGGGMVEFERRLKDCDASSALLSVASFLGLGTTPESIEEAPIATYDYPDETGEVLFQIVRLPDREGKKQIRARSPDFSNGHEWRWDTEGVRRVLYRLPEVLNQSRIIVTEGEKDADTVCTLFSLHSTGIVGTTNPFGARNWLPEFSECLRGKDVVILPDNDDTGAEHAQSVFQCLSGVAGSVKIVEIPREPGVKDVSDFLVRHSPSELIDLIGFEWFGYEPA